MNTKTNFQTILGRIALTALALTICGLAPLAAYAQVQNQQATLRTDGDAAASTELATSGASVPGTPKPAPPSGSYNWTGAYAGGHFGYSWGRANTNVLPQPSAASFINLQQGTRKLSPRGVFLGGQGGYNWQTGIWVIGAEFDIAWNNMSATRTTTPIPQNNGTPFPGAGFESEHQDISWSGNLRPRVGVTPANRVLLYLTAGLAFGHVNDTATTDFRPVGTTQYPAVVSKMKTGYTAGGGAEFSVNKRWSIRGEYLFIDLGSETANVSAIPALPPFSVTYSWQHRAHTLNFGVNYHF